jgi:hypothetical protein
MARITVEEVRGWVEVSKLNVQDLDLNFLPQLETEILAKLGTVYDTTTWIDPGTTPDLVRVIITKLYAGWIYDRAYSENQAESNPYAAMLKENAGMLIAGLIDGTIEIPGVPATSNPGPSFYPNDASSALEATYDDPSLGPARFSMGRVF